MGSINLGSNGTITNLAVGGLPDGSVDADSLASNSVANVKVADDAIGVAELSATGTASSSTYLRGDNSWATVTSVGGETGTDYNDNVKVRFGTGNDLEIYHDGTNSQIKNTNASGALILTSSQDVELSAGNDWTVHGVKDAQVELYYNGVKKFETTSTGFQSHQGPGTIQMAVGSSASDDVFIKDGSINWDSNYNAGNTGWISIYGHAGGTTQGRDTRFGDAKGNSIMHLSHGNANISGDFNDTSDERLKKNIVSIGNEGLTKINQLRPVSFTWRNTDRDSYGFVAQEVETILPKVVDTAEVDDASWARIESAATGIAIRDTKSLNTNSLVAYLTKAIQELSIEVETLKTKVAALEAG